MAQGSDTEKGSLVVTGARIWKGTLSGREALSVTKSRRVEGLPARMAAAAAESGGQHGGFGLNL